MAIAVTSSDSGLHRDSIFRSVFPKPNFTTPTPEATPNIGSYSSPGRPFGGFNHSDSTVDDAVRCNRAWSTTTRYLALSSQFDDRRISLDGDVLQAFLLLIESPQNLTSLASWYANEVSVHFRNFVLPTLQTWQQPIPRARAVEVLQSTVMVLRQAQQHYLGRVDALIPHSPTPGFAEQLRAFQLQTKQSLHTLLLHSLPRQRLQKTLASVMFQQMHISLQGDWNPEQCLKDQQCHCKVDLEGLDLRELHDVGLGGLLGERAFAHAVHKFLQGPAIERRCFEVDWNGHTAVVPKLRVWVERQVAPMIGQALASLTGNEALRLTQTDVQQFVSLVVATLGRLRTLSLFDYVKAWPASTGAILDIWECINAGGQPEKAYVCHAFSEHLQRRLLHAGATTVEILSIYVNVIHAFKSLDSRGVLLEKVAVPIRNYLRARDDTVSIIAASFLADLDHNGLVIVADPDKVCPDISVEIASSTLEDRRDSRLLNWTDMEWMPDPIDAGPEYSSSRSDDVVASILGLFEQEEFIKEVTSVLAQHLLHATDSEYVKETRLIELLKSRLDATKLQAAEVMLKDVRDSVSLGKRINPHALYDAANLVAPTPREIQTAIPEEGITLTSLYRIFEARIKRTQFIAAVKLVANKRNDLFYAKRTRIPLEPQHAASSRASGTNFKTQMLSSFFWPQLRSNQFNMPSVLQPLQTGFEHKFSMLGSQRKLEFRPALARVSVRLELEDRVVEESDVAGWRASVIDAFASERSTTGSVAIEERSDANVMTVEQLTEALEMEEELVLDALGFWTNKNVLYQQAPGVYAVLERLDIEVAAVETLRQQDDMVSAVKSQNAMLRENAPVFETFIVNMLRNQGPKEVGGFMGITNLLKMVLPTFTYGDDEVRWLLGEMEGRGQVTRNSEVWAVAQ